MPTPEQDSWTQRVLRISRQSGSPKAALKHWQRARAGAITQLRVLSSAIRATEDPEGNDAIILLEAIAKNLTSAPSELRQVKELQRYLTDDSIIEEAEAPNGFGLTVAIREPLLAALQQLRASLSSN